MIICSSLVSSHRCCCMSPHFTGLRVCKLLVWLRGIGAADWWRRPHCTPPSTSSSSTEFMWDPQHICWGYSKLWQGQVTCPRLTRNIQMGCSSSLISRGRVKSPQDSVQTMCGMGSSLEPALEEHSSILSLTLDEACLLNWDLQSWYFCPFKPSMVMVNRDDFRSCLSF